MRSWSSQVNILFLCFVIFLRVVHLILVIDSPFVKGTGHINSGGIDKIINLYKENATKFDRPNWAISFIDAFIISVMSQTRKLALFPHTNCSKRLRIQRSVTHDVYPVGLLLLSSKTQFISCWQLLFSLALSFFSLSLSRLLSLYFLRFFSILSVFIYIFSLKTWNEFYSHSMWHIGWLRFCLCHWTYFLVTRLRRFCSIIKFIGVMCRPFYNIYVSLWLWTPWRWQYLKC